MRKGEQSAQREADEREMQMRVYELRVRSVPHGFGGGEHDPEQACREELEQAPPLGTR